MSEGIINSLNFSDLKIALNSLRKRKQTLEKLVPTRV